ncbi:MAG: non-canonical purine NTP pyrophosphatase, partial [Paracoccus sp. (in: a-proteobacteria)]
MRRFDGRRLLVATHNAGKLAEMQALLAPFGVTVIGAAEAGLSEPAETEQTFLGNARIKARAAVAATGVVSAAMIEYAANAGMMTNSGIASIRRTRGRNSEAKKQMQVTIVLPRNTPIRSCGGV